MADRVVVQSRSYADDTQWRWESSAGSHEFKVKPTACEYRAIDWTHAAACWQHFVRNLNSLHAASVLRQGLWPHTRRTWSTILQPHASDCKTNSSCRPSEAYLRDDGQLMSQGPLLPCIAMLCSDCPCHCPSQLAEDTGADMLERGTRVTLHLKDDAAEYAGDKKLGELIKQYSEFIAFPIKLWAEKCAPFTLTHGHTLTCPSVRTATAATMAAATSFRIRSVEHGLIAFYPLYSCLISGVGRLDDRALQRQSQATMAASVVSSASCLATLSGAYGSLCKAAA